MPEPLRFPTDCPEPACHRGTVETRFGEERCRRCHGVGRVEGCASHECGHPTDGEDCDRCGRPVCRFDFTYFRETDSVVCRECLGANAEPVRAAS